MLPMTYSSPAYSSGHLMPLKNLHTSKRKITARIFTISIRDIQKMCKNYVPVASKKVLCRIVGKDVRFVQSLGKHVRLCRSTFFCFDRGTDFRCYFLCCFSVTMKIRYGETTREVQTTYVMFLVIHHVVL